ncbi:MAG: hypothetical protein PQJ61_17085 [Spirochaetales bacterium]|uniref:Uncharacterized protein n=1 Tax=Candidatus Thalassospirochaeta sargassi TaxID=3119039 RepID=A0AAJ1IFQ0_9SPIO|nr:hypothetical protein [Spirochaetales bacterium]
MKISISFYGNLIIHRTEANELKRQIQIPGGMTVSGLLVSYGISEKTVKAVCNGKKVDVRHILMEDDYLQFYSLNSGG